MELRVEGEGEQEAARDLLLWLRREGLPGAAFDQKRAPPMPDAMSAELIPILTASIPAITAAAASPVAVELIKAIQAWFVARRPKVKVNVSFKDGRSVTVDAENVQNVNALLSKLGVSASGQN